MESELKSLLGVVGDALYFHHIHIAKPLRPGIKPKSVTVEGKPRRMMVLGKKWWIDLSSIDIADTPNDPNELHWYPVRAKPGYLVVELRSECPSGREAWYWNAQKNLLPKSQSSDALKDDASQKKTAEQRTWIGLLPMVYPAECCSHGRFDELRTIEPKYVDHVMKEMWRRGLGYDDHIDPITHIGSSDASTIPGDNSDRAATS